MTSSDIIAIIAAGLSALSLMVSLWAAYRATRLSGYQLRLSTRSELHKMLLEIDRELLHDPSLGAMFESLAVSAPSTPSQTDIVKQKMYITMYLNLFELSFSQFKEIKGLTSAEEEMSAAWDRFIISFFKDCKQASEVWVEIRETYYSSFRDYVDGLISELSLATHA